MDRDVDMILKQYVVATKAIVVGRRALGSNLYGPGRIQATKTENYPKLSKLKAINKQNTIL